jgi:hypothetical protein
MPRNDRKLDLRDGLTLQTVAPNLKNGSGALPCDGYGVDTGDWALRVRRRKRDRDARL